MYEYPSTTIVPYCRSSVETRHVNAFCANFRDERSLVILARRLTLTLLLPPLAAEPQLPSDSRLPSRATPCLRSGLPVVEGCRCGAARVGRDDDDDGLAGLFLFRLVALLEFCSAICSNKSRAFRKEKSNESADDDSQVVTVRLELDWLSQSMILAGQPPKVSPWLPFRKPSDRGALKGDLLVVAPQPLCVGVQRLLEVGVLVAVRIAVPLLVVPRAFILRKDPLLLDPAGVLLDMMTTGRFLWEDERLWLLYVMGAVSPSDDSLRRTGILGRTFRTTGTMRCLVVVLPVLMSDRRLAFMAPSSSSN